MKQSIKLNRIALVRFPSRRSSDFVVGTNLKMNNNPCEVPWLIAIRQCGSFKEIAHLNKKGNPKKPLRFF